MEMLKILVNKVFLIYDETSRSPLLLYVAESGGYKNPGINNIIRRNGKAEIFLTDLCLPFFYFCRSHTWPIGKDGVDSARKSSSAFSKNSTARLLVDFGYLCLIL